LDPGRVDGITAAQRGQRRAVGCQASEFLAKTFALASPERDERAAGVAETVRGVLAEQRDRRATPLIQSGSEHDKFARSPALDLPPAIGSARPVTTIPSLRHDAFEAGFVRRGEEGWAATDHVIAELQPQIIDRAAEPARSDCHAEHLVASIQARA